MYSQYFGLKENPFALSPDPRYLYLGWRHQEALAHLTYGITEGGGFVQLTGEVGTGKTMLTRALLERLPDTVDVALVLYPFLSVREFVAAVCDDLHVDYPKEGSLKAMIDALNTYLLANHAKGRRTVLIVDEAHKLSLEVLEQIRLLTNLETTKEKLLQIILVGQPELNVLLAREDLRQLAQRVTARYDLSALQSDESSEYVQHRCRVAGTQMPLFSRSALRAVHRFSGGIPRVINVLCDRALLGAYAVGKQQVSGPLIRKSANEVSHMAKFRWPWRRTALIGGLAALAVVAALVAWRLWPAKSDTIAARAVVEPSATIETTAAAAVPVVNAVPNAGNPSTPPVGTNRAGSGATTVTLANLLADETVLTDTDTAFTRLFAHWNRDYAQYTGTTGCDRARQAGLSCLYESGTWNNLRQLNRPVIIELTDARGQRHHVSVAGLKGDRITLELGDQPREFTLTEVEHFWFGKYLALWNPPEGGEQILRMGMQGPVVLWLRDTLARAGLPTTSPAPEVFDAALAATVIEFQRRHQIDRDGVVGRVTLMMLTNYDKVPPPVLARTETSVTRQ